jgi:histone acetyltransferase MYST1
MPREKKKLSATATIITTADDDDDDDDIITADDSSGSDEGTTTIPSNKKQRRGGTPTETETETETDNNKKQQQPPQTTTTTAAATTTPAAKAVIDTSNDNKKVASKLKIKTDMSDTTTTTTINTNTNIISASNNSTSNNKQQTIKLTPTGGSGSAMDNHPYARGAVIEVLHGVKEKNNNDDDENGSSDGNIEDEHENMDCDDDDDDFDEWWDKDSDVEDDDDKDDNDIDHEKKEDTTKEKGEEDKSAKEGVISVRLCDVIDRVSIEHHHHHTSSNDNNITTAPSTTTTTTIWRYYVHYRDFNRRMDEWISMDRIVSPPSVGNAKARAIKREEEKKKRLIQREKEKEEKRKAAIEARSVDVTAPRASRRRSTTNAGGATNTTTTTSTASAGGTSANNDSNSGSTQMTGNNNNSTNSSNNGNNAEDGNASDGGGGATTTTAAAAEEGTRRGTRLRRKSTNAKADAADDDDKTVVAGNNNNNNNNSNNNNAAAGGGNGGGSAIPVGVHLPVMAAEKGTTVSLPTIVAEHSDRRTKVGEHGVVQTIAAQELDEHEGLDEASLREHEEVTKVKNVAFLELGAHQMSTWYFSPLPKELLSERGYIEVLYVCEFTLRMFSRKSEIRRFQSRLPVDRRHPPGNEIYRKGNLSMFEVDGFEEKIYCQNLCYIAKLFLDHKTLYFDVDPFLFYVLCEVDERGFHPVGYYSKEKYSDVGYNLACILTFPSHQRKGYGRFLIAFSYELSKKEEKVGSPEKPMSDLGQQAYKPYWASTIVDFLLNQCPNASMSIMDISKMTSIMAEDIVFTLNQLSILKIINGVYFIAAEEGLLRTLAKKYPVKEPRVDATKLHWTPFIMEVKRDKFSIHSKKPSVEGEETRGAGGF